MTNKINLEKGIKKYYPLGFLFILIFGFLLIQEAKAKGISVGTASDNIGIGTDTPGTTYRLNVNGNSNITGTLNVTGGITGASLGSTLLNASNVSAGTFGSNSGGGNYTFPSNIYIANLNTSGRGQSDWYNINTGSIGAWGAIYGYNAICTGNNSGSCNSTNGTVLGINNTLATNNIPNSGTVFFNSGNVGIGTSAVNGSNKLDVIGGGLLIGAVDAHADASLHITTAYGGFDRLTQMAPSSASKPALNLIASTNGSNSMQWWSWGVTPNNVWAIQPGSGGFSGNTGLFIDSSGSVGIGTVSPQVKLDVKGKFQADNSGTYSTTYSWAGGTIQTNSLELMDRYGGSTSDGVYPTLTFHDYGNGGAQFSMEGSTATLHLGSGASGSAGTLAGSGGYFSKLKVWGAIESTGTISAASFSGAMSGTLNAANVSAGTFGGNTGSGNYAFPGSVNALVYGQDNTGLKLFAPGGASYVTSNSSVTGAIRIKLPAYRNNTMMRMTVKIYQYNSNKSYTVDLGGYNYQAGGWYNTFANVTGGDGGNLTVRFGNDGSNNIIWIGETNSSWSYPQVYVTDFQGGYSGYSLSAWASNWNISFTTAFDSVETVATSAFTWNSINDGSGCGLDADMVDGVHASSFWNASGSWKPGSLSSATRLIGATSPDGGEFALAYKGGQVYPYTDGWFYQNEGQYRVLDTSDAASLSVSNSDTVDSLHASAFLRAGTQSPAGNAELAQSTNSSSYSDATLELRELNYGGAQTGAVGEAPRLSFHWGGRVASQITMLTDGAIQIRNNPGTGYETLKAGTIYSNDSAVITSGNIGSQSVNYASSAGSASSASSSGYSNYLSTNYVGGVQSNPQTYFNQNIGLKVAMTGYPFAWADTLWINGYAGGDVLNMIALHTARNGQPRMWLSSQASNSTSFGTAYEFITDWNIASQSVANATYVTGFNSAFKVAAGDGNGLKFWNGDDSYKISMGVGSLYQYGPVTDYSIKAQMDSGSTGRGFTWGRNGSAPIAGLNSYSGNMQIAGQMTAGGFVYNSDVKLKKNINTIDNSLAKILQLRGVSFNWKKDNTPSVGLIAQEVEKVFPELVSEQNGIKSVQYGNLVAPLIEAVKEQQKEIQIQTDRANAQQQEIESMKAQIQTLQAKN